MWQALLKSQKLAVILEPANGELADCIAQIADAGLTLPDVIVLDAEAAELNPYEFCRWCRSTFPKIRVFLTRCSQMHISDTERRWAKQQGATDFLCGFNRDTLMTGATENVKHVLTCLDYPFLHEKALLTVLLNIRRQLSSTQATATPAPIKDSRRISAKSGPAALAMTPSPEGGKASARTIGQSAPDPLNDLDWVTSGLRSLSNGAGRKAAKDSFVAPPAVKSTALPNSPLPEEKSDDGPAVRRYRGVVY